MSSMKLVVSFQTLALYQLPSTLNLDNYIKVFTTSNIMTYFKNSLIVLIITLICLLTLSSLAAFALSKITFKGRSFMLSYFLLGLIYHSKCTYSVVHHIFETGSA